MVHACYSQAAALAKRNSTSPNVYIADLLCDPWAGTHVVGPFLLYCFTQNPWVVFLITGLNELFEQVARTLNAGGGIPLIEDIEGEGLGESLTNSLVDDWLTQGSIGLLLGGLFMYHLVTYALVSVKVWRRQRSQWYFYGAFLLLWFIAYPIPTRVIVTPPSNTTLPRVAGFTEDKSDLWIGFAVVVIYHGFLVLQAWAIEPYFSTAWKDEPAWKRPYFWFGSWGVGACFEIQSMWDYLQSSAIQTWAIAGAISIYLIGLAIARHQLPYFIRRFDSWALQSDRHVDTIKFS